MKFFIPHAKPGQCELEYQGIADALKRQFRLPIVERRIFSLKYTDGKNKYRVEVGQLEEQEDRYEILAIFECKCFMVVTRAANGSAGPTILVDKSKVTAIEDFDPQPVKS